MTRRRCATRRQRLSVLSTVAIAIATSAVDGHAAATPVASADSIKIDLPTVLRLARAENLDVQLARAQLEESRARVREAWSQFFPWVSPGVAVQRHEGRTQAVDGTLLDVDKQNVRLGASVVAQVDVGAAIFDTLAAKQTLAASSEHMEASEEHSVAAAAQAYFELLEANMLVDVSQAALETSQEYGRQLQAAVQSGVAFKGDALRVQTQSEHYRVDISQAREHRKLASTRLAHLLHLDVSIDLVPEDTELVPITLVDSNALQPLVEQALMARPELKQSQALVNAARSAKNAAIYGPLIPSLTTEAFVGEFGGGRDSTWGHRASSDDYYVGLRWRIGPGGLFDFGRIDAGRARLSAAEVSLLKVRDDITHEVVEGYTRAQALAEQIAASGQTLDVATQTLKLTRERKQLGVGVVLEDIQAQQELNRARAEHIRLIAEFNKVQYALNNSIGQM